MIYVVMKFDTKLSLGQEDAKPEEWINTDNIYFTNGLKCLGYMLSHFDDGRLEVISGNNMEEVNNEMNLTINNYKDKNYLNNNVYPLI